MIIDLHSHYPMHLLAGDPQKLDHTLKPPASLGDALRALALRLANQVANYQGPGGGAAVRLGTLTNSDVRVVLSVLYAPFEEMDLGLPYGAPPRSAYIGEVFAQMDMVEKSLQGQSTFVLARNVAEMNAAVSAGKSAIVHAIEGGFHLGDTPGVIRTNVQALAQRGVAYVTLAHLFWRQVATNAPALPFLDDQEYRTIFPEPATGLTELGRAALAAMVANGILVDVTHMTEASFTDTFDLLDQLDPDRQVPVLATHSACRLGGLSYSLSDDQIRKIAERRGVIGLIACTHYIASGSSKPHSFTETVQLVCKHIDHIHQVTGSHMFTALGSDQDGFIKPALPGLETPAGLTALEHELIQRYGSLEAGRICQENAERVLSAWGTPR